MAWPFLAQVATTMALSFLFAPRPKVQKPVAETQINGPTVEVGTAIPVLFGTRLIQQPIVTWYGELRTAAVKKKGGGKK